MKVDILKKGEDRSKNQAPLFSAQQKLKKYTSRDWPKTKKDGDCKQI